LDERREDTMLSKTGGATCSHGLASDIGIEIVLEACDEKIMGGNIA
jgi:hypothetical protein